MTAQSGRNFLLRISDGNGGFLTVAGLRTRRLALNADTIDITDAESAGRWRELLGGAGVRRASISATGIFKDRDSDSLLRQSFFDGVIRDFQIFMPDFGILSGPFQISNLDYRGEYAGEITFDISLDSADVMAFSVI
jgi:TP901-1 family phage major tail protein